MARILHLGVGNFHRAHQAWYTAHAGDDWHITGVVMRNTTLFQAMQAGAGYRLGIRGPDGLETENITLHDRMILASRDPALVLAAFADPDLQIVTLTITEKGYCLDAATGALDLAHPDIVGDLAGQPKSAVGLLAHGLARRAAKGLGPLTVLSCDNLSGNGRKLARATADFARAAGVRIDAHTRFPDTMVDRITPATTPRLAAEIAAAAAAPAPAPVMTEAFTEWVIEDDFAGPRPAWETAGAELVRDVAPFEMRKLRLLNAAHSWLAYAGLLAGHTYVHQAMADPRLANGVERLWDEAQRSLPKVVQDSTAAYRAALRARFAVPEMRHELAQIAVDGSLKLRERITPLLQGGRDAPQAGDVIAVWIAFVLRCHRSGTPLADANADKIAAHVQNAPDLRGVCAALAQLVGVRDDTPDTLGRLTTRVAVLGA